MKPEDLIISPDPEIKVLIPNFLKNRVKDMTRFEASLKSLDFKDMQLLGHTWKGMSRPYGFIYLETIGIKLEEAGKQQDLPKYQPLVASLHLICTAIPYT